MGTGTLMVWDWKPQSADGSGADPTNGPPTNPGAAVNVRVTVPPRTVDAASGHGHVGVQVPAGFTKLGPVTVLTITGMFSVTGTTGTKNTPRTPLTILTDFWQATAGTQGVPVHPNTGRGFATRMIANMGTVSRKTLF